MLNKQNADLTRKLLEQERAKMQLVPVPNHDLQLELDSARMQLEELGEAVKFFMSQNEEKDALIIE